MKQIIIALPLTFIIIGCSGPIDESATNSNSAIVPAAANATPVVEMAKDGAIDTAQVTPVAAKKEAPQKAAAKPSGKPDSHYKVVNESDHAPSPEAAAALQKEQVPPPPANMKVADKVKVKIDTTRGPITVELNGKAAPLHVKSYLYLGQRGFFTGTQFHRYEPGFVIQGGDPLTRNQATEQYGGMGGPGYQIPREYNDLKHDAMVLAAARTNDPDSAGSQFYFTLDPAPFLDNPPGYTVFGKVLAGKENVLKLRKGDKLTKFTVLK